jgi:hypothetical protein
MLQGTILTLFALCSLAASITSDYDRNRIKSTNIHSDIYSGERMALNFLKPPMERSLSMPSILRSGKLLQRSQSSDDVMRQSLRQRTVPIKSIAWRSPLVHVFEATNPGSCSISKRIPLSALRSVRTSHICRQTASSVVGKQDKPEYFRPDDENDIWLEEIDSEKSLQWVTARNAETLGKHMTASPPR